MLDVGKKRQLMWDDTLIDKSENVEIRLHNPQRQNVAFVADAPWEKSYFGYMSTVKVGDTYRIYYRASVIRATQNDFEQADNLGNLKNGIVCVIESRDGINFTRPKIGNYTVFGSNDNNIVYMGDHYLDSFSVYYDENPNCPADEKFKALSSHGMSKGAALHYYKSCDGYRFEYVGVLDLIGAFDSLNLVVYDEKIKKYRAYYRSFHMEDGSDFDVNIGRLRGHAFRDIRTSESVDMKVWEGGPLKITYFDGEDNLQLYTNGVTKYHRADVFYGMATRYNDRKDDIHNLKYLPNPGGERDELIAIEQREGTAMTDCIVMHSYDGYSFYRCGEALVSPGPENGYNWFYGDCYAARGLFETPSAFPGEPNELSLYMGSGKGKVGGKTLTRYTLRLDGFYSWNAKKSGGSVLTKPFKFDGNKLSVNFKTSAFGSLHIKICDENGKAIEGYDSRNLFGDSVDRPVDFEKDLSALSGKTVRLEIFLSDCDLYSFIFE
ncbi:MAG: hypothetical protein IKV98_08165 [Clostridia bacterium]|nr:hypothetical protein [Clostridia bacterium]